MTPLAGLVASTNDLPTIFNPLSIRESEQNRGNLSLDETQ
jgi:hypothetical protein